MREIEFRGKTAICQLATADNRWVYGGIHSIFENDDTCYISVNDYFNKGKSESLLVKKETIVQYTGLKDKNGKKIFEGDIVAIEFQRATKRGKAVISYLDKYAGFVLTKTKEVAHEYQSLGDYQMKYVEVIGNIYDNPELLEDK